MYIKLDILEEMNVVRHIREVANVTQSELARLANTSQPTIAAYETGAKMPSLRTLNRLAASVGLNVDFDVVPALTREDRRSIYLHRRIAEHLKADPGNTLTTARTNLALMRSLHPEAGDLFEQWEQILSQPVMSIVDAMTDTGPEYRELRQVTPFAGVLDAEQRASVYREFRREDARR
jgi:transcriptional regulator with XRE-family HTH domain